MRTANRYCCRRGSGPWLPQTYREGEWRNRQAQTIRPLPFCGWRRGCETYWGISGNGCGCVSVAAVALPTAIAYAELIGFEPVVGLYAAILPLLVMRFLAHRAT
jgi:MFS superfamily sulfate permease-like transporter